MSEELNDIKNIVSDISTKVDQHEIRIQAIEGWKKQTKKVEGSII